MLVEFKPDFKVTDAECRKATGKPLKEWFKELEEHPEFNRKRREAIQWMYDSSGRGSDVWWPTTIWVEYEKSLGIVNKKDGLAEGFNICCTKTMTASVTDVYNAWTSAKGLATWFGSDVKAKVADKGPWSDGDGNSGEFLRVRENKDLRFTWNNSDAAAPTLVDVTFQDKGKGKTGLMLNHQRIQNRAEADGLRYAWSAALEQLKATVEKS